MTNDLDLDLDRFLAAQRDIHAQAHAEIARGRKTSHWMWFVYPQLRGLGRSAMATRYGIASRAEAEAYLRHAVLGSRLVEMVELLLAIDHRSAHDVFGSPDDLKLRSCLTLFDAVSPPGNVFGRALEHCFGGSEDEATLERL